MGFYEYWREEQARKATARQELMEKAQAWIGRRVWCQNAGPLKGLPPTYGEVAGIDERGVAHILIGYDQFDQPQYRQADIGCFGGSVVLAEE